jgi:hypothetical protein
MIDMSSTIIPKSDQLNADDLVSGSLTIRITKVSQAASADQPIIINYEGDGGKPYKPCKIMRRLMVQVWGKDGEAYVGHRLTLYRDPEVKYGGEKVGGIRISHMSGLEKPQIFALTITRATRRPHTVKPLPNEQQRKRGPEEFLNDLEQSLSSIDTLEEFQAIEASVDVQHGKTVLKNGLLARLNSMLNNARERVSASVAVDFGDDNE